MKGLDRRAVLGLASTVGVAGAAGCQALEDVASNDDGREGTVAGDASGDATATDGRADDRGTEDGRGGITRTMYEEWLPATDGGPYFAYAGDAQAVVAAELTAEATTRIQELFVPVPESVLSVAEVDQFATGTAGGGVCTYEIDAATLRDRLAEVAADADVDSATPPEGYEAFADRRRTYWLGGDHLLAGTDDAFLRRMVATKAGDERPYAEALLRIDTRLPDAPLFAASAAPPGLLPDDAGVGYAWNVASETVTLNAVVEFVNADAAAAADVESATGEWPFGAYDVVEIRVDEAFAFVSGAIPKAEFDLLAREQTETAVEPPEASFGVTFDTGSDDRWNGDDAERVAITHEGGDAIPLDEVVVVYANRPVDRLDRIESTPPSGETWTAGGTWTLSNASSEAAFAIGETLFVTWIGPDGGASHVLATDTVTTY